MGRLEGRIERLEALAAPADGAPSAVVRFNPAGLTDWLPAMFEELGWPGSLRALVTIDASGKPGEPPIELVPPVPEDMLTNAQQSALVHAGRGPGPWLLANSGRGWAEAVPMPDGEAALLAELRRERQRPLWETNGEL